MTTSDFRVKGNNSIMACKLIAKSVYAVKRNESLKHCFPISLPFSMIEVYMHLAVLNV